jgi:hypothetical protein
MEGVFDEMKQQDRYQGGVGHHGETGSELDIDAVGRSADVLRGEDPGEEVIDQRPGQDWREGLTGEILGEEEIVEVAMGLKDGAAEDLDEGEGAVGRAFDEFGFQGFGCIGKAGEAVAEFVC